MRETSELSLKEKVLFWGFVEPIALVTANFICGACWLRGICPLHKKVISNA
jgi:hypothetical protein